MQKKKKKKERKGLVSEPDPNIRRPRGDHFRFGSVFTYKKQPNQFFFEKKTELKPSQTDRFRSGSVRFLILKNRENLYAHISSRTRQ